ncbi:LOW QUALITY PROTEIN: retrotransposon-like protein 1 [Lissotriton helveticus]
MQFSAPHLILSCQIHFGKDQRATVSIMIDSGATGNFCDILFAKRLGINLVRKIKPEPVRAVDGTPLSSGPITFDTEVISVLGPGKHCSVICFSLIDAPQFQLILGLPWLTEHNPKIDWAKRTVDLNSEYCLEHCFHSPPQEKELGESYCLANQPQMICLVELPEIPAQYQDLKSVFDEQEAQKLPPHREYDCTIELEPGASLPCSRIYALSESENLHLKEYLDKNLANGFIRPSQSPVSSPLFFIPKKDKSLRTCIDYRALNLVTRKNRYPLPLISELLDQVKEAHVYTKLDLRGAYHLVRMAEGDEWKMAFRTRFGLFEYQVMPFGLCNAPAAFQHFVNDILREFLDRFAVVYIDDILIFSKNMEEHVSHVRTILECLLKNQLYVKLEKCVFHTTKVEFLGFILSPDGVSMDESKLKAIRDWPAPSTVKEIQSFLGFANFYRRFIQNFSEKVSPITRLLRKKEKFVWGSEAEGAFQFLKESFISAPILQHPDPLEPFFVEADASNLAIGGVLSQRNKKTGQLHPVAYYSRKLSSAELNYAIADKELLAVKDAFLEWRHYLLGARHVVTVFTDHRNLQFLKSARTLTPRQLRWSLFFADFDFVLTYKPGVMNGKADALSRLNVGENQKARQEEYLIPKEKIVAVSVVDELEEKIVLEFQKEEYQNWESEGPNRSVKDGRPFFQDKRFVPGEKLEVETIQRFHDLPLAGHKGVVKTLELVKRNFLWPGMEAQVRQYVATCEQCLKGKSLRQSPQGLLMPLPVPPYPWHTVSMDFIVELPSCQGNSVIWVVVDQFSKMSHFVPLKNLPNATELASLFVQHVVKLHGIPKVVISDRGPQFVSRFWRSFLKGLGVDSRLSTGYHPETDGQTERVNQDLEQYLRLYLMEQEGDWPSLLHPAEFAYNNSVHSATGFSPFFLNSGRHPNMLVGREDVDVPAVEEVLQKLQLAYQAASSNLVKAKAAFKRQADKGRKESPVFEPGDQVWVSTRHMRLRGNRKFQPRKHPPNLRKVLPPAPVLVDSVEEFEVKRILDSKVRKGQVFYLVDWKGYGPEDRSWEPSSNIHAPRLYRRLRASVSASPRCLQQFSVRLRNSQNRRFTLVVFCFSPSEFLRQLFSPSEPRSSDSQPRQLHVPEAALAKYLLMTLIYTWASVELINTLME